ncbi:MAG: LamG-like jellyroll fold domain-containing protein [Verrucomicrobiales bacterium]
MDSEHLEAYLSDELDDHGREQVRRALRNDAGLRDRFQAQVQLDAALRVLLAPEAASDKEEFEKGVLARLRSEGAEDQRGFAKSVLTEIVEERESIRPIRWPDLVKASLVSAAASITLMFFLQTIIFTPDPEPLGDEATAPNYVARLERSQGLEWSPATARQMREDGWLSDGRIEIDSGTAMIAFNSGATAIVEGPAELSLKSNNRVFLQSGRLTADVPPAASGFTVTTPRLNAVDIGTRFGVSADENGDSELHVMEGEVEASRTSGNSVTTLVREGLALRADGRTRSELQPVPYGGDRFTMRVGRPGIPEPALRYNFDESGGAVVEDSGVDRAYDVPLVGSGEMDSSPLRSAGRYGGGLVFQPGETLDVTLSRDFRLEEPHTIAFRVKIPPRFGQDGNEVIARYGRDGVGWSIGSNLDSNRGTRGALRIDHGDGHLIGTTDIADGKWHHVACRFIGGENADVASHVHLFVDGRPESVSESASGSVKSGRVGSLGLGGNLSSGLHGWIDDLTVFREAISTPALQTIAN